MYRQWGVCLRSPYVQKVTVQSLQNRMQLSKVYPKNKKLTRNEKAGKRNSDNRIQAALKTDNQLENLKIRMNLSPYNHDSFIM